MRKLLRATALVIFTAWVAISCQKKGNVSVEGQLKNSADKMLVLYRLLPDSIEAIDSTETDGQGNFKLTLLVDESGFYLIQRDPGNFLTLLLADGEQVTVAGDGNALSQSCSVKGSAGSDKLMRYFSLTSRNNTLVDSLSREFQNSKSEPDFAVRKQLFDSAYTGIFNKQKKEVAAMLSGDPASLANVLIIQRGFGQNPLFTMAADFSLFSAIDSVLDLKYPRNPDVTGLHKRVTEYRVYQADLRKSHDKAKPGTLAPSFSLTGSKGEQITSASLKGKMVLLYFWASWNGPCRQMNMQLMPVYNEFAPKGFEIVAVSFDNDKKTWEAAYRIDKVNWRQVWEKQGIDSPVARDYGIRSLQQSVLIGRDGTVLARNLKPEELKSLLLSRL